MSRFKLITTENEKGLDPNVPEIIYPDNFRELDNERKIIYLKKLTSSLNHALDMVQNERNKALCKIARHESLIENLHITIDKNKELYAQRMNLANEREQELKKLVIEKDQRIRTQDRVIESLSGNDDTKITRVA